MVMELMQGKLASSQFDFGYTEQFCIPGLTSVLFSSCDSVVGDSLEFNQANRGSLRVDRKSTRLNSSHRCTSRMPSSA